MARLGSGAWNGRRARVPQQWCRQPAEKGAREAARSVTASMGYVGLILRCGRGGGVSKLYGERGCEGANRLRSCQPLTEVRGSETDNLEGAWQWFHFGMTLRSSRDDGVLVAPAAAFPDTQQDHNQTASRSGGNLWANRGGREPVNPPVAQPEARRSSTPNERVGHHRIA